MNKIKRKSLNIRK